MKYSSLAVFFYIFHRFFVVLLLFCHADVAFLVKFFETTHEGPIINQPFSRLVVWKFERKREIERGSETLRLVISRTNEEKSDVSLFFLPLLRNQLECSLRNRSLKRSEYWRFYFNFVNSSKNESSIHL